MNLNMFFLIYAEFEVKKKSVSSFYKENNFKPCLAKQLFNMFKLWCERGIRVTSGTSISFPRDPVNKPSSLIIRSRGRRNGEGLLVNDILRRVALGTRMTPPRRLACGAFRAPAQNDLLS